MMESSRPAAEKIVDAVTVTRREWLRGVPRQEGTTETSSGAGTNGARGARTSHSCGVRVRSVLPAR
eukprot:1180354-Prorocentrum_minimum.AAC.5